MRTNADRSKIVCAALIALSVTACAQGGPADPIGDGCQTFRPIFLADYEWALLSDETALAIEVHNETGAAVCGWGAE